MLSGVTIVIKKIDKWINKKLDFNYKLKILIIIVAFFVGLTLRLIFSTK